MISNKIIDTQNFHIDTSKKMNNATGKDVAHIVCVVPTKSNPNLNDALNDVFRNTDSDLMTDAEIKSWWWYVPYIYGQVGWSVSGDAVKTRSN